MIHQKAETGFSRAAEAYDRGRPTYPQEAIRYLIEELDLRPGRRLIDLGAGTGKLTRLLAPSGADILAVEPVEAMRERLRADLPGVDAIDGVAERVPVPDASADVVVVAQAFHWFDGPRALAECHRILRPDGWLALVWNERDERVAWVSELTRIMAPFEDGTPRVRSGRWREAFTGAPFEPLSQRTFANVQQGGPDMVCDRVASVSFIAALPEADRMRVIGQVRDLLATAPETRGRSVLELPYETHVYTTRPLPAA
jgi:SAM-dependent methyltransferase